MTTQIEALRTQVGQILAPAKETYEQLGQQIETKMEELVSLRHDQAEVRKLIRAIEPDFEKRAYDASKNGKGRKSSDKYSAAKISLVNDWLRENATEFNSLNDDGFYASQIVHYAGCPVPTQSGISACLAALHEQGLVRLTRQAGRGGRKYFKVVI